MNSETNLAMRRIRTEVSAATMLFTPLHVVRECTTRYARRNFLGVFALLSPDVRISATSELPWGGRFGGYLGARNFFIQWDRHLLVDLDPRVYIPAGNEVVIFGRIKGRTRTTGSPVDMDIVHVCSVCEGRVNRLEIYVDAPAMQRALAS
jgi:ketosteroid isomerase-like protein